MKKYLLAIATVMLMACQQQQSAPFDANQQLDYCASQVDRALKALCDSTDNYDYSMEPRNILEGDTIWNCRKVSEQEWCSGFWPGVLWMDYDYTKDENILKAAKGYTQSLSMLGNMPAHDHDLGFLVIGSFLKGYSETGNEDYHMYFINQQASQTEQESGLEPASVN